MRIYSEILKRAKKEPERNFLIVVPDQFTMQTQKEIVTLHPNHGSMNIDIVSFQRLASRILTDNLPGIGSPMALFNCSSQRMGA